MAIDLPAPAIIEFQDVQEVRFGLSYAPSRTELDRFVAPRDWRDATIEELRAYIPGDLMDMPDWAIRGMFPLFARKVGGGGPLIKTTVFLTSTSGSNQNWSVLSDWNSSENIVHVIAGGGSGGGLTSNGQSGGGGGGAYSATANVVLSPAGVAVYRLGSLATTGSGNGGSGSDCWFNGTSLGSANVGAKGGAGGTTSTGGAGGASASGVGSIKYSGGNGANGSDWGGGGGAGGPDGAGGNALGFTGGPKGGDGGGGSGGTGGGNAQDGGAGTEFQESPARGSGGGSGFAPSNTYSTGFAGGLYGGGGGGTYRTSGTKTGGQGAQGLIVIINNHINGI